MPKRLPFLPLSVALLCLAPLAAQQKYTGPRPTKPDLPYLLHADNLVPTESLVATEEDRKNEIVYVIAGDHSTARTPLASPVFLIQTDQLQPDRLQLFELQSKNGHREVVFRRKNKMVARAIRLNVTRQDENLYKIEVDEILPNGEYSLSPAESNQVFCFQIY